MKNRYIPIIIALIVLILLFSVVTPVELEGTVESKAINGRLSGNIVEGILFNSPWENES